MADINVILKDNDTNLYPVTKIDNVTGKDNYYTKTESGNLFLGKSDNAVSATYATSASNSDTLDGYHANKIYQAHTWSIANPNTSCTYRRIATITIPGTTLAMATFTLLLTNREVLDGTSVILYCGIRRNSPTSISTSFTYTMLGQNAPRNLLLRSDDGVTFYVYFTSAANSWTTYYLATPLNTEGNIVWENTGCTEIIAGSNLNITASKSGQ